MLKLNKNKLYVFHEGRKRRIFVGELNYDETENRYQFIYDRQYANSKTAIPVGPDLELLQLQHDSQPGKLFASFIDRIPDRDNPAYEDYCYSKNISPHETNQIILLGTIGSRGPSSFIFEPVYVDAFDPSEIIQLRQKLQITQHDLAQAFDISKPTLQRIEAGRSHDLNTLKRIQILLRFPTVALWQLRQSGGRVHKDVLIKLIDYFISQPSTE